MDVVRDVLDMEVVDRNGRTMGRVDGLLMDQAPGEPPRLTAILIGPAALAWRLHPALGHFMRALERRVGLDRDRPVRIDFADVVAIDEKIHVRFTISDTAVAAIEERLRGWVSRLPGSR